MVNKLIEATKVTSMYAGKSYVPAGAVMIIISYLAGGLPEEVMGAGTVLLGWILNTLVYNNEINE